METVEGVVSEIVFQNEDNGYIVARLKINEELTEVITGIMPGIECGMNIHAKGRWVLHDIYGSQFNASSYEIIIPSTENAIKSFLSSGIIKGIGSKMADRIVERFGTKTLEILQNEPQRLLEIEGIGKKKLAPIIESYNENMGIKNIILALSPYGITPKLCIKIYKKYSTSTMDIIQKNPYQLIEDIHGIGFKMADDIARKIGFDMNSNFRIYQGILYILKNSIANGHTFLPEDELIRESSKMLEVEEEKIEEVIYELALERKIVCEKYGDMYIIYLEKYYRAEVDVCKSIIELCTREFRDVVLDIDEEIERFQEDEGIELAIAQKQAVKAVFNNGVTILTGGPGTGKTTTINTMISLLKKSGKKVVLAAPTGRAAKRMTETTGNEAKTIHRLLEMAFDTSDRLIFMRNEEEPIDADVVIVDEASMIDIFLMDSLLKALGKKTRLVIVGDSDQLPSVGAGNVLSDLIDSGVCTVVRLTEIFRQAQQSDIIINAHRINHGEDIVANNKGGDFYFINKNSESEIIDEIKSLVSGRLSKFYNVDSIRDVQILSPMRKGVCGVSNMNSILQEVLNSKKEDRKEVELMKNIYRVGDKVMQKKNNYSRKWENEAGTDCGEGIYNGDIGYIYHIDKGSKKIYILFDENKIFKYGYDEMDEIEHSYCTTVHKSQGSEFPVVIMPMTSGPPMLLNRNLLYTAITRAKKLVVIVGIKKCMDRMIVNNRSNERYSNLGHKLKSYKINNFIEEEY